MNQNSVKQRQAENCTVYRQTDRQTDDKVQCVSVPLYGRSHNNRNLSHNDIV